jgi:hypothetical protein
MMQPEDFSCPELVVIRVWVLSFTNRCAKLLRFEVTVSQIWFEWGSIILATQSTRLEEPIKILIACVFT